VGLAPGSGVPYVLLQDFEIREEVREQLAWTIHFFEDSEGIWGRQGGGGQGTGFKFPRDTVGKMQKETSTLGKIMWAFSGKKRAETVLLELGWFVDRLHELVPTSGRVGL